MELEKPLLIKGEPGTGKTMLAEAIKASETSFPKEKGEELLVKFGIGRKKPARWTEKQKEEIRKTLKEVQSWTKLAEEWLEKYLEVE